VERRFSGQPNTYPRLHTFVLGSNGPDSCLLLRPCDIPVATGLKICPPRRWRSRLIRYHKYTRLLLIALVIVHFVLHVATDVYGIPV